MDLEFGRRQVDLIFPDYTISSILYTYHFHTSDIESNPDVEMITSIRLGFHMIIDASGYN